MPSRWEKGEELEGWRSFFSFSEPLDLIGSMDLIGTMEKNMDLIGIMKKRWISLVFKQLEKVMDLVGILGSVNIASLQSHKRD